MYKISIIFLFFISSCTVDIVEKKESVKFINISQASEVSFKMDGALYTINSNDYAGYFSPSDLMEYTVYDSHNDNNNSRIYFRLNGGSTGEYLSINEDLSSNLYFEINIGDQIYTARRDDGSVKMTLNIDQYGNIAESISGTFSGTVHDRYRENIYQITDGKYSFIRDANVY